MKRAYKVRIYPNATQKVLINKTIGCCRFIYNAMLAERKDFYQANRGDKDVLYSHTYKSEKEYKQEYEWLKEVDAVALQQANRNLFTSYRNFFRKDARFPRFHKKTNGGSYRTIAPYIAIDFEHQKIKLPKLGWVKYRDGRKYVAGKIINVTVSKTPSGKYYCSVCLERDATEKANKPKTKVMGLDMSLSNFYVDQNGNSPEGFIRFYRSDEKRLVHYQKIVSRRQRGSKNRAKANHKVSVQHERIANKRRDFQEKLSKKLVHENDMIVLEDLNMKGMSGGLHLGKSVNDLGWSQFVWQLQYKGEDAGCRIVFVDRFFPSSKVCNSCGYKNDSLKLSDREWVCPNCGKHLDRDTNAAMNLYDYGIGQGLSELTPVESRSLDRSRKQEYGKADCIVS